MTTLLFCTSYAETEGSWERRYRRWVQAVQASGLHYDVLAIIDDGSPLLPDWAQTHQVGDVPAGSLSPSREPRLFHHAERLGRHDVLDFPGWYRSFAYSVRLARAAGADRIVHIESDAFVLSAEMVDWINGFSDGWAAPYSPTHGFPEMAIQVVAGSSLPTFAELFAKPYDWLKDVNHEQALPFTHVVRPLLGDRYAGNTPISRFADFSTQTPSDREAGFHWWMDGVASSAPALPLGDETVLARLDFGSGGGGWDWCGYGWSLPEDGYRWAVAQDSYLTLPPEFDGAGALLIDIAPCVHPAQVPFQKVEVLLDGVEIGRFKLGRHCTVRLDLPRDRRPGAVLRFHHPDAVDTRLISSASSDTRELAFAVLSVTAVA
jgi:hypothetical protein